MVDMLLYAGANVAAVTRIGQYTPLHLAGRDGSGAVVRSMLKAGADRAATPTESGVTALHLAAGVRQRRRGRSRSSTRARTSTPRNPSRDRRR